MSERHSTPTLRSGSKQQSLPQALFKRQYAVDQPACRSSNPAIIFSTNNSVDSASPVASGIPERTAQRLRQERFGKGSRQQSSLNSSVHSNGDVRSFLNRSRKSSLFDLRESAFRKFSIIPQVSLAASLSGVRAPAARVAKRVEQSANRHRARRLDAHQRQQQRQDRRWEREQVPAASP